MHDTVLGSSQVTLVIRKPLASARDKRDTGSVPGSGRFLCRRAWQPTPVFLPGEPMDRGAWWATVHRVVKSWT